MLLIKWDENILNTSGASPFSFIVFLNKPGYGSPTAFGSIHPGREWSRIKRTLNHCYFLFLDENLSKQKTHFINVEKSW